ncbi:MAG: CoA transferase, partial [Pseudomonadota bacterium]|nr:CoA transferase [Pseudomonadota bacterium]
AGILHDVEHPRGGLMRQPRNPVRFSQMVAPLLQPSADLGEHTVEVLADLGLTLEEMQDLARQGVIG